MTAVAKQTENPPGILQVLLLRGYEARGGGGWREERVIKCSADRRKLSVFFHAEIVIYFAGAHNGGKEGERERKRERGRERERESQMERASPSKSLKSRARFSDTGGDGGVELPDRRAHVAGSASDWHRGWNKIIGNSFC